MFCSCWMMPTRASCAPHAASMYVLEMTRQQSAGMSSCSTATGLRVDGEKGAEAAAVTVAAAADAAPGT